MLLKMVFLASCLFVHELWRVKKRGQKKHSKKDGLKKGVRWNNGTENWQKNENWKKFNIMKKSTFHLFIIAEGTLQCDKLYPIIG